MEKSKEAGFIYCNYIPMYKTMRIFKDRRDFYIARLSDYPYNIVRNHLHSLTNQKLKRLYYGLVSKEKQCHFKKDAFKFSLNRMVCKLVGTETVFFR